ncbi:MAG: AMP-binding protein [Anaerolineae bacterium]|jgi:acyl-CoA synthetase (AMP-forming)/AMP-acid ligase II|nr:AMP-binding protein [Anaerolineae bacterium]
MDIAAYETLTQAVQRQAAETPERTALIVLGETGEEFEISAGEFHRQASQYAWALAGAGIGAEDLVILVLRHSPELLFAFWGALYLGTIGSIFPFLTDRLDPEIYLERVRELVIHARARAVITYPEFEPRLKSLLAGADCQVMSVADVIQASGQPSAAQSWQSFSAEKIAFLQHSSGTTGLQKGVALSHRSVLNQIRAYSRAIELNSQDVIVSWLPLYHDMGLIAGFVMPLVAGVPLVLMSPFKWVVDPKTLLWAIHQWRGTLCWLPNFAYNHMARVIRQPDLKGLDLSSMRAFINCSEPVYLHSHAVFASKLALHGVKSEMLSTCYAMAENTFAVTQNPVGAPARTDWVSLRELQEQRRAVAVEPGAPGSTAMVSCGFPIDGTQVRIVDEGGEILPERRVGEIALRSDCMLSGYYRRPELTEEAIRSGWYFTGDMGYLAEGELFVTGRKKDLIIVGGKNIYPQDLEAIASQISGVVPGRCAAFGLYDAELGSEKIVMVCEVDEAGLAAQGYKSLELELRKRVVQQSEVALSDVRLVSRRWLLKTSSGKVARSVNRDKYLREFGQEDDIEVE